MRISLLGCKSYEAYYDLNHVSMNEMCMGSEYLQINVKKRIGGKRDINKQR